jgi:hypothetical protein
MAETTNTTTRDVEEITELSDQQMRDIAGGQIPANGWVRFTQFLKEVVTFGHANTDWD